jgi:hypothetical protein
MRAIRDAAANRRRCTSSGAGSAFPPENGGGAGVPAWHPLAKRSLLGQ